MSLPENTFKSEPGWTTIESKPKMSKQSKMTKSNTTKLPTGYPVTSDKPRYLFDCRYLKKDKVHFIPKNIKSTIDNLFERSVQSRDLFREINKEVKFSAPVRPSVIVYILNQAAGADKLEIIEYILANIKDRSQIVNVKCGTMAYTPIFKSAYRGSIRAIKMLLCAGADLTSQNTEGETVMEALEQGLVDELSRNPDIAIFTQDRYDECRAFITNYRPVEEKVIDFNTNATIYKSRFNTTATAEEAVEEAVEKTEEPVDYSTISVSSYVSDHLAQETDLTEFLSSKDDISNILIDILSNIFDKGLDEKYKSFIQIIKSLSKNETFKQSIIECVQSEIIQETVKLDAPYALDDINNVCKMLKIATI